MSFSMGSNVSHQLCGIFSKNGERHTRTVRDRDPDRTVIFLEERTTSVRLIDKCADQRDDVEVEVES